MTERIVERNLRDSRFAHAMFCLLEDLRDCIKVYGVNEEAHKLVHLYAAEWESSITESGPIKVVLDAMRMYPQLWQHAIPKDSVIVDRKMMQTLIDAVPLTAPFSGTLDIEMFERMGWSHIENQAARLQYEQDRGIHHHDE